MNSIVDDIKASVKLSEIVRRYISIPSVGKNGKFYIACPFHNEKSPSCVVQDDIGLFHCFGCGASGDLIKFVEKIENIPFLEACNKIANWFNIQQSTSQKNKPDPNIVALQKLNMFFVENLTRNLAAVEYLKSRNIHHDMVEKFQLGFIPQISKLNSFLKQENISDTILNNIGLKPGLLKIFQNRIAFPIYNKSKVCSFAGRILDSQNASSNSAYGPKYINGAESTYFKKQKMLFGLNITDKSKPIIVTEGYMDAIKLHQHQFNAVSVNSSSISQQHLQEIFNYHQEAIICLDGDAAGIKGMQKIIENTFANINENTLISFIFLPDSEDPDSFIEKYKASEFMKLIENRIPLVDAAWKLFMKVSNVPEIQYGHFKNLLQLSNNIPNQDIKALYVQKWKELWKTQIVNINSEPNKSNHYRKNFKFTNKSTASYSTYNTATNRNTQDKYATQITKCNNMKDVYEKIIIACILNNPEIYNDVCEEFLGLNLSKQFEIMHELIPQWIKEKVEFGDKSLDFFEQKGCTILVSSCNSDRVMQLAPFAFPSNSMLNDSVENVELQKSKHQDLVNTFQFILHQYKECS